MPAMYIYAAADDDGVIQDRHGRRTWLLCSLCGMCGTSMLMGHAYYTQAEQQVKVVLVVLYVSCFAIGLGPLPWLLCSEMFHSSVRSMSHHAHLHLSFSLSLSVCTCVSLSTGVTCGLYILYTLDRSCVQ